MTQVERHVGVPVVDGIQLFSLEELLHIMFYDWVLRLGSPLSSGGGDVNAVAESEDVVESLVLEGVLRHINQAVFGCDPGVNESLLWLAWLGEASN